MKSKTYFKLRDEVWANGSTGHTKAELHKMAKDLIWPMLLDEAANFIDPDEASTPSTLNLSEQGWDQFIEQFKASFVYA
jgi:hypothetical protein